MNSIEYVFPVSTGEFENDNFYIKQICGTAFYIGDDTFLTAAHVINNAKGNSPFGIGFLHGSLTVSEPVYNFETKDELDIGIIKASLPGAKALEWNTKELFLLADVLSTGYPYGLDLENFTICLRAFAGYIVSSGISYQFKAHPRMYELSFQCPRGLSGAPLLSRGDQLMIEGIIVGNQSSQMLVFSNKEIIKEGNLETIVERYESLQLGIALQGKAILDAEFSLLDGTLRSHLLKKKLLLPD